MNQRLPAEFAVLGNKIEGMSDEVVSVFRYSLARLLVETGRLSDVSNGGNSARFRTADGVEFELPNPDLPAAQTKMVEDHLRWLMGF